MKEKSYQPPMVPRANADLEMKWVDAWNDLCDLVNNRHDIKCLLADHTVVDIETCKAWLQHSVYTGYDVSVAMGWHEGSRVVVASRCNRSR